MPIAPTEKKMVRNLRVIPASLGLNKSGAPLLTESRREDWLQRCSETNSRPARNQFRHNQLCCIRRKNESTRFEVGARVVDISVWAWLVLVSGRTGQILQLAGELAGVSKPSRFASPSLQPADIHAYRWRD